MLHIVLAFFIGGILVLGVGVIAVYSLKVQTNYLVKLMTIQNDKKMNELLRKMEKVVPTKLEVIDLAAQAYQKQTEE